MELVLGQWVCCPNGSGLQHKNGVVSSSRRHFLQNSVGKISEIKNNTLSVWLIGTNEIWDVSKDDIEILDVTKTGDKFRGPLKKGKMEKFTVVTGAAALLDIDNIDTDMLIPKGFLKTVKRTGLGVHLFREMRYDDKGGEIADFVLNCEPYRKAKVLVAGKNFGCGSSREHAPWALADFGIRVILAESFADIFFSNTAKNGILALALPPKQMDELKDFARQGREFCVNLTDQKIEAGGEVYSFEIDGFKRKCLLEGLDDIDLILQSETAIDAHEEQLLRRRPWLA